MAYLVIFQGKTEQFDDRTEADLLVQHLKTVNVSYKYTVSEGKAQPKTFACKKCDMEYYTETEATYCYLCNDA